ncbi:MAG TPA: response regulator [Phycisphaerales bacterium]|nr:response regulator [Phycisphaerales bacterium]
MRVLLIDDSKTMRGIQRSVVAQFNPTDIEEAADGQDGLSKAIAFQPDLILVDSNMPRMDGLAFVRSFRQTDKHTPVIMVASESEKSRVVEAIRAGVNNYLIKPFTPDLLNQRIAETLARRSTAANAA